MRNKIYSERRRKFNAFFRNIFKDTVFSKIVIKKKLVSSLEIDPLTHIYNHFAINNYLKELHPQPGSHYAIVLLNLDNYEELQKTYGLKAAEKSLVKVASTLTSNIRDTDLVGKYGEHEFILILSHIDLDQAKQVAQRCLELIQNSPIKFNAKSIPVKVSCGVSISHQDLISDKVLQRADQALFLAKSSGFNQLRDQNAILS